MIPRSPVPQEVSAELKRVVERWHQLPLDRALSRAPAVRELVDALAGGPVRDLGPGVLMDQLTVVVYDTCRTAADADSAQLIEDLTRRLGAVRRSL